MNQFKIMIYVPVIKLEIVVSNYIHTKFSQNNFQTLFLEKK